MRRTFNIVMRIVSSLIGLVLVAVGFMVGDYHWTIYGAILALVGLAQVIWSNTRQLQG
jgi:hypothetical protein